MNTNDIRFTDDKKIIFPHEIAHSNTYNNAVIDACSVGGVYRVQTKNDLYNIPSELRRNEGFRVYVLDTKKVYKLNNWYDDGASIGTEWVEVLDITIDSQTGGVVVPFNVPLPIAKSISTDNPKGILGGIVPDGESIYVDPVTGVATALYSGVAKIYQEIDVSDKYNSITGLIDISGLIQSTSVSYTLFYAGQRLINQTTSATNYQYSLSADLNTITLNMSEALDFNDGRALILLIGDDPKYTVGLASETNFGIMKVGSGLSAIDGVVSTDNTSIAPKWQANINHTGGIDGIGYSYNINYLSSLEGLPDTSTLKVGDKVIFRDSTLGELVTIYVTTVVIKNIISPANVNLSEYVNLTGIQTISGSKKYTSNINVTNQNDILVTNVGAASIDFSSSTGVGEAIINSNIPVKGTATTGEGKIAIAEPVVINNTTVYKIPATNLGYYQIVSGMTETEIEDLSIANPDMLILYTE